jgi:fibro-slime domain-containing protein
MERSNLSLSLLLLASAFCAWGCSANDATAVVGPGGDDRESEPSDAQSETEPVSAGQGETALVIDGSMYRPEETTMTEVTEIMIIDALPNGFSQAQSGGWQVLGPLADVDFATGAECANVLRGISRDQKTTHADFNNDILAEAGHRKGIVADGLGDDRKPALGSAQGSVTDAASFAQWFNNVPGVNEPFAIDIWLEPVEDVFIFDSAAFFPLKGHGYSLDCADHCDWTSEPGYSFTTELHTSFQYKGGEVFNFRGDDDVWVFIDGKLVVDLGGLHTSLAGSVDVDALGLTVGEVYNLDFFHAERRFTESNFRIETTLDFSDCGEILTQDIVVK